MPGLEQGGFAGVEAGGTGVGVQTLPPAGVWVPGGVQPGGVLVFVGVFAGTVFVGVAFSTTVVLAGVAVFGAQFEGPDGSVIGTGAREASQ